MTIDPCESGTELERPVDACPGSARGRFHFRRTRVRPIREQRRRWRYLSHAYSSERSLERAPLLKPGVRAPASAPVLPCPLILSDVFLKMPLNQRSSTLLLGTHSPGKFISNRLQHTCLQFSSSLEELDWPLQVHLIRVVAKLFRIVGPQELGWRPLL